MNLKEKKFVCPRDSNERTFGITSIFRPVGAFTMALYMDTGDPTFVIVLRCRLVITDFAVEDNIKEG